MKKIEQIAKKVRNKILFLGVGPWGYLEDKVIKSSQFGFFGEFGYGVISWLPYLKYLSECGFKISGVGIQGQRPLWNFASEFTGLNIQAGDSFGSDFEIRLAKKMLGGGAKIIAPANERRYGLYVNGEMWENPFLHQRIFVKNYSRLTPDFIEPKIYEPYVVINFKNYFNWGNPDIVNFYVAKEISHIVNFFGKRNIKVVLNRFPSPLEATSIYTDDSEILKDLCNDLMIDMAPYYDELDTLDEKNALQFGLLKNAQHIFATQGGNAAISIVMGKNVSILMRGGSDWPDYKSLSEIYDVSIDIGYELNQFRVFQKIA